MNDNGDVLAQLRKVRRRLDRIADQQAQGWQERRELYAKARANQVPLKLVAQAAGVSESAVTLALREHRDTPTTPRGSASV